MTSGDPAVTALQSPSPAESVEKAAPHLRDVMQLPEAGTLLEALPAAIYVTDASGSITFYNEAAVALWGRRPELGKDEFCGSWKLYWPDGTPLPHDECPMAIAIKERRAISGMEAMAERPGGERVRFLAFPAPFFDALGTVTGAINLLVDITDLVAAENAAERLAAIVQSSADAIVAKDLNGVITAWNRSASQMFGYTAEEAIGRSVTMLIPDDRLDEEPAILDRIRRGIAVETYSTVRKRKDGSLLDVSLTVSPLRSRDGRIIGASKIARDITERKRAEEQRRLLLREMNHRITNLFALSSSLVSLCARTTTTSEELALAVRERLGSLARAHALTLSGDSDERGSSPQATTIDDLVRSIVSPYCDWSDQGGPHAYIEGADIAVGGTVLTTVALLLHEFATNAAKYGALSTSTGRVHIRCIEEGDRFTLIWSERGGPPVERPAGEGGFGNYISRMTVERQLGGEIHRDWDPQGLTIRITALRDRLTEAPASG